MYRLVVSRAVRAPAATAPLDPDALLFSKLGLVPCGEGSRASGLAWHAAGGESDACVVVHGHMWSQPSCGPQDDDDPLYVSAHRHAVPVVLVTLPAARGAAEGKQRLAYLLCAPKPVCFSAQCRSFFSCVELTSLWSPCAAAASASTMFEWWSLGGCSSATPQRPHAQLALDLFRSLLQRMPSSEKGEEEVVAAAPQTGKERKSAGRLRADTAALSTLCLIFPSLPPNAMAERPEVLPACVQRIVCLSTACDAGRGRGAATRAAQPLRTAHFSLARRLFSELLRKGHQRGGAGAATALWQKALPAVHVLAEKERRELLLLLGRPSYPNDYVAQWYDSNGDVAPAPVEDGAALKPDHPRPLKRQRTDRTEPPRPSLRSILQHHGSLSNAAHRVVFRSASANKKLPVLHGQRGAVLLQLVVPAAHRGAVGRACAPPLLSRIGVITSAAPFYIRRMGCQAVFAWCCLDHRAAARQGPAAPWSERYTAGGRAGDEPGRGAKAATRWLLASPETARALLAKAEELHALQERVRRTYSEPKGGSRPRRVARFAEALRSFETDLCHRELAAPVTPVSMYI
ncbi:hypothetical protein STCU_11874 [Strigomonas culicis]|uniref:Uncharacterized protein n=1 Tax=Strigomonas culicis TaxID=28005 RepID=S9TFE8_9TRYP|nr:hypothetical protein STCU_11874 [Strigomonas culicis]|eukprot:EPY15634.1 hypothetical protein STCU_11874 [Strigomonas culicis]